SPTVWVFAAILVAFGLCDAITDVAMNAHGIRVQTRHGSSLLNRFHALWSLGAVLGAAGGSVAAGLGGSAVAQMAVAGLLCADLALPAPPPRLPARVAGTPGARDLRREPRPGLAPPPA